MRPERREHHELASHSVSEDLVWLAFRYSQGELSAAEAETFEERLATEQPAREALAEAAKLSELTHAALARELAPQPSRRFKALSGKSFARVSSWVTVGAAACLALFLALSAVWPGKDGADNVVNGDPSTEETSRSMPQWLAQAFPSGMDAWPITDALLDSEPSEDDAMDDSTEPTPGLADDWIAIAVIAAHDEGEEKR
jgi:hypothetical protein